MENEKNENTNSLNSENPEVSNETQEAPEEAVARLKETNRQLFERAKKAEVEMKELRGKLKGISNNTVQDTNARPESQSNEPDYAKLAFLKIHQVEHPDDQKVIMEESNRLKLPLTDVLQMEHIKAKLSSQRDARNAQLGMPTGNKRKGTVTQNDVDYWLQKGGLPEGDQELAEKIVNARLHKETSDNMFAEVPFIG